MVRVHVKRHQGIIQEVEIRDHAGYADAGQDLVCAGVSSIAVGMMNALDEMVPEACDFVLKHTSKLKRSCQMLQQVSCYRECTISCQPCRKAMQTILQ